MGREASCTIRWQGATAQGRVLLEAQEIILRGDIRARIPRATVRAVEVRDGMLAVTTDEGTLELDLGAGAEAWRRAVLKPPPSLAEKLGFGAERPAFVHGDVADDALAAALVGAVTDRIEAAGAVVAELRSPVDLASALAFALAHVAHPVWCVYPKGKGAVPSDDEVRRQFRAEGFVDTKSCAVSPTMTATRYQWAGG